jgi:hypothetical protein
MKLRYTDASFISRLGLTYEREVAVLQQVRAAAVAGPSRFFS